MRKNHKSQRKDIDQIIIEELRGGGKTPKELLKQVVAQDVTKSSYHRHIIKLVNQGTIKRLKFELGEEISVEEEDEKEISEILEILNREENPRVLQSRISTISYIAHLRRVAQIPRLLTFCENALSDPKYRDKGVMIELIRLLREILHFESIKKPKDYQKIMNRMSRQILETVLGIMEKETNLDILGEIIYFLSDTEKDESVNALFKLIDRLDDGPYDELKSRIFRSLLQTSFPLQIAQRKRIEENMDKLLRSVDQRILKRGEEISRERFSSQYR